MVTLKDKTALLSPERRAKIEAEADRLQDAAVAAAMGLRGAKSTKTVTAKA